jgi:hypothetical protein
MATQCCVDAKLTISGGAGFSMRVIITDATRQQLEISTLVAHYGPVDSSREDNNCRLTLISQNGLRE